MNSKVPGSALPSSSALSHATAEGCGRRAGSTRGRRSILPCRSRGRNSDSRARAIGGEMSNRGMAHIPGTATASDGVNRRLAASVLLINLLVIVAAGFSLYKSFGNYQERAEITTRNLATVLAQNIESTIDKVDLGLLVAADEIERQ